MFWGYHHLRKHPYTYTVKPIHGPHFGSLWVSSSKLYLVVEPTHLKKYARQNGCIFPKFRGENKKYLSCHQPVNHHQHHHPQSSTLISPCHFNFERICPSKTACCTHRSKVKKAYPTISHIKGRFTLEPWIYV